MTSLGVKPILIILCLLLGGYLRFNGITWGIPSSLLPHPPLHPDEVWAMQVLSQINIFINDFNPEEAHREGTFAYFLWSASAYILKLCGLIQNTPYPGQPYNYDYATVLLAGRVLTATIDIISGIFVFLIVRLCTNRFLPSLLAMFLFMITPFEVIHAHYMRTHIIANFFITATIYFSFKILTDCFRANFILVGLAAGLGIATRYPTGAILIVPAITYIIYIRKILNSKFNFVEYAKLFFCNYNLLFLILGLASGVMIGLPFLLLDFDSAKPHLFQQATYIAAEEFSLLGLLKLDRIAVYITYLIPYGTLPYLWVIFYGSLLVLIISRTYLRYSIALISFMVIYLYLMAKGYFASPIFIRAAIPIFPPLAICAGLAFDILRRKMSRPLRKCILLLYIVLTLPSIFYLIAYTNSMGSDPRIELSNFISNNWRKKTIRIGAYSHPHNYITIKPSFDALPDRSIVYVEKSTFANSENKDIDFLVLSSFEYGEYPKMKERSHWLKHSNKFSKVKTFSSRMTFMGFNFDYQKNPHDLSYPFPTLELWKRK